MDLTLPALAALVRESIADPRAAARRVLALPVPAEARWMLLALVVVVSVILTQLALWLFGMADPSAGPVSPLLSGGLQAAVLVVIVAAVDRIGRLFGGRGSFADALLLVTWLQVVMIALQLVQLLVLILVPPLGGLVTLASLVIFFWVFTGFVAELHGFASRGQVFVVILMSLFLLSFLVATVLAMLGITPPGV